MQDVPVLAALMVSSGGMSGVGFATGLASYFFYGLYIAAARWLAADGCVMDASPRAMPFTLAVIVPALPLNPSRLSLRPPLECASAYLGPHCPTCSSRWLSPS
ncbi:hypothetical protein [Thermoproteus tenax]|uniref:hypothetical protein n=1 Tax=Thermoproteus tenax TaxID=2271 RepID=UPI00187256A0|nr:hypothetical protein [Thermoproteus tenax]